MELYNQIKQVKEYLLAVKLLLHCGDGEIRELLVKDINEMEVKTVFRRRAMEKSCKDTVYWEATLFVFKNIYFDF